MTKKYFTRKEALESIKEVLENGFDEEYSELFDATFNIDHYIIYTKEAEEALTQYGVFDALRKIQEYENDNFGRVNTDLSDAIQLVDMLWYIIGEGVTNDIHLVDVLWNEEATEENNKKIINEIDGMIKEL